MTTPREQRQLDESIETDLDFWIEVKHERDEEQLEWDEADFSPESGDNYSVR